MEDGPVAVLLAFLICGAWVIGALLFLACALKYLGS